MDRSTHVKGLALAGMLALSCFVPSTAGTAFADPVSQPVTEKVYPLHPDDPAAQLDPSRLNVEPASRPAGRPDPSVRALGSDTRTAFYSVEAGEIRVSEAPTDANATNGSKRSKSRLLFSPGSPGAELQAQKVFGPDERRIITNTSEYPWRVQCKLWLTFPDGTEAMGSGTLVSPQHVLTAGHCVWSKENGGWAKSIEVIPGLDGTHKPFGSFQAKYMRTYAAYVEREDRNHDWALITIDQPIGKVTGWFGFGAWSPLKGVPVHIAGYPGDRMDGLRMFYHFGPVDSEDELGIKYRIDTFGGQSGSSVFLIYQNAPYTVAVHTWGDTVTNGATRLNQDKFDSLVRWINQDLYPPKK